MLECHNILQVIVLEQTAEPELPLLQPFAAGSVASAWNKLQERIKDSPKRTDSNV